MTMEQPRYMQILSVLSQRVETGQYPLEERLPTESELCDEFGASRFTVREALRRLVDHGMVQRRQGAGSVVVAASPQARYVHSLSSLADLSQFALDTHYELLSSAPDQACRQTLRRRSVAKPVRDGGSSRDCAAANWEGASSAMCIPTYRTGCPATCANWPAALGRFMRI